jgi:hypothetical protein
MQQCISHTGSRSASFGPRTGGLNDVHESFEVVQLEALSRILEAFISRLTHMQILGRDIASWWGIEGD